MENNNGEVYILDFFDVDSTEKMHQIIEKGLDFPDYYGKNWDAFWDCLTDKITEDQVHIEIRGLEDLKQFDERAQDTLMACLKEFKHYANDAFADRIKIEIVIGAARYVLS